MAWLKHANSPIEEGMSSEELEKRRGSNEYACLKSEEMAREHVADAPIVLRLNLESIARIYPPTLHRKKGPVEAKGEIAARLKRCWNCGTLLEQDL